MKKKVIFCSVVAGLFLFGGTGYAAGSWLWQNDLNSIRGTIEGLGAIAEKRFQELGLKDNALKDKENQLKDKENQLLAKNQELEAMGKDLAAKQSELVKLKNQLTEKDGQIQKLQEGLTEEIQHAEETHQHDLLVCKELEAEIQKLIQQEGELQETVQQLQEELKEAETAKSELESAKRQIKDVDTYGKTILHREQNRQ